MIRYKCQLLTPLLKTALTAKCDGIRRDGLLYEKEWNENMRKPLKECG